MYLSLLRTYSVRSTQQEISTFPFPSLLLLVPSGTWWHAARREGFLPLAPHCPGASLPFALEATSPPSATQSGRHTGQFLSFPFLSSLRRQSAIRSRLPAEMRCRLEQNKVPSALPPSTQHLVSKTRLHPSNGFLTIEESFISCCTRSPILPPIAQTRAVLGTIITRSHNLHLQRSSARLSNNSRRCTNACPSVTRSFPSALSVFDFLQRTDVPSASPAVADQIAHHYFHANPRKRNAMVSTEK